MSKQIDLAVPPLDRIIIKQDEATEKIGSIFLSEREKKKPRQGTVIKVGKGALNNNGEHLPMMCKPGYKVFYPEFVGNNVVIDSQEYIILKENELILILETNG